MSQGSSQSQQIQSNTNQPPQTVTAQDILQSLELSYQETSRNLATVRESLTKSQEAVIAAQDASFKAFQLLCVNKERHLINLIGQHQQQNAQYVQELTKVKQMYNDLLTRQNSVQQLPTSTSTTFLPTDTATPFLVQDHLTARPDNISLH